MRQGLLLPDLLIDKVEDLLHHVLLHHGPGGRDGQERWHRQTRGSNRELVDPVLCPHFDERSPVDLLQGNAERFVEAYDGSERALLL